MCGLTKGYWGRAGHSWEERYVRDPKVATGVLYLLLFLLTLLVSVPPQLAECFLILLIQ